jgi:spermidine synthase
VPATPRFEELDFRKTDIGDLILRKRTILSLDNLEVHEIILGDAYLMTSLFTEVEQALSRLGLAATEEAFPGAGARLEVVVGGLGLGYTARAALEHESVASLIVVDYLLPVIEWHEQGLVPLGAGLSADERCRFVHGDFFGLAVAKQGEASFDPDARDRRYHAVLLDIDHSPSNLLSESNRFFYSPEGLSRLAEKLHPGGIFALWSDDAPDEGFMESLRAVFETCESHIVSFHNPLRENDSASTVYVARRAIG